MQLAVNISDFNVNIYNITSLVNKMHWQLASAKSADQDLNPTDRSVIIDVEDGDQLNI